ncbi:MAG: hybrid sensor histidine kinase/response regulator, partial [Thiomargarita sp.]|nr:hybrid sensor histidine kinase/response regulator [Thiomargarita sp.]
KTKHIPIIFLTAAYKSEEFKKKGYELGAIDYLTKPIETYTFITTIQDYLQRIQKGETLIPHNETM